MNDKDYALDFGCDQVSDYYTSHDPSASIWKGEKHARFSAVKSDYASRFQSWFVGFPFNLLNQPFPITHLRPLHILSMSPLNLIQNPEIIQSKQTSRNQHASPGNGRGYPSRY